MDAKNIKLVVFDTIGVLFSSTVIFDGDRGEVLRTRSHIDGQGISLLRSAGIRVVFMSASDDGFIRALARRFNGLPSVVEGRWPPIVLFTKVTGYLKVLCLGGWLKQEEISWDECAYMGDDIGDYQVMQMVGLRAAPVGGEELIKKDAHFISQRRGGEGAVRDFCDYILSSKSIDITTLDLF